MKLWVASTPLFDLPAVELSVARWFDHVLARHPEMAGKEALVFATVERPTHIVRGNPGSGNWVFVNHDERKTAGQPLVVIVNKAGAFVCTTLYDRRYIVIDPGAVVWSR